MVSDGDTAPTFTATVGTIDHGPFDLDDHLGDGPVVLVFEPPNDAYAVHPTNTDFGVNTSAMSEFGKDTGASLPVGAGVVRPATASGAC
jgi:hypothetical protein